METPLKKAEDRQRNPPNPQAAMDQQDFVPRSATNDDAPLICQHISQILRSYGIVTNFDTTDRDLADIEAHYKNGAFFTLWRNQELVGTAAFRMLAPTCAEICRMYVSPEHRGKGIGKFLLSHVIGAAGAKGATSLVLKTASVLKEAIQLYTKEGFLIQDKATCGNCDLTMVRQLRRGCDKLKPVAQT